MQFVGRIIIAVGVGIYFILLLDRVLFPADPNAPNQTATSGL